MEREARMETSPLGPAALYRGERIKEDLASDRLYYKRVFMKVIYIFTLLSAFSFARTHYAMHIPPYKPIVAPAFQDKIEEYKAHKNAENAELEKLRKNAKAAVSLAYHPAVSNPPSMASIKYQHIAEVAVARYFAALQAEQAKIVK
jgi:hypothetical protein